MRRSPALPARRLAVAGLALAVVLLGAAAVVVLVLGRVPERRERALAGACTFGAAAAAVAYEPARRALRRALRPRVAGGRTPAEVLGTFGEQSARGVPVDELLLQLAEATRRSFAGRRASVWTVDATLARRVAVAPDAAPLEIELGPDEAAALTRVSTGGEHWLATWAPSLLAATTPTDVLAAGAVRVAPARQGGQLLGLLVVERAPGAEAFGEADDRALGELGRRLGDALRTRQLDAALRRTLADLRRSNDELRASRARLVAVSDQERRRIERDLHDGAQQHLVALAINLGLARDLVATDPDGAAGVLDALAGDLRAAVQELRDLAHGIYPPTLRDNGLADALVSAARRAPVPTTVHAETRERLAPEAEAALYFCCLEALQNVAKHAPGAHAVVTVRRGAQGGVEVEVRDDGPGFAPQGTPAGHGMQNMADRIGAVGGTLAVDAAPGRGVRVVASAGAG